MQRPLHTAYVSLGANLGEREAALQAALTSLQAHPDLTLTASSPLYETAPVGGPPQPPYLNAAAALQTTLSAQDLLDALHAIEADLGRTRDIRWGPRTLDLDLLMYDALIIHPNTLQALHLPHPRMHLRRFVLQPLADIAPDALHPALQQPIAALLAACPDRSPVVPFQPICPAQIGDLHCEASYI